MLDLPVKPSAPAVHPPGNLDSAKQQRVVSRPADPRLAGEGRPESQVRNDLADELVHQAMRVGQRRDRRSEAFFQHGLAPAPPGVGR